MRSPRTREEARQQALQQLRSRPRSADDDTLGAWFAHRPETLAEGVLQFIRLAGSLIGTNRYVQEWRHVRTKREHDSNTGLDILAEPDEFIRFQRSRNEGDDRFHIETIGFSNAIPREAPNYYTAGINYSGACSPKGTTHLASSVEITTNPSTTPSP